MNLEPNFLEELEAVAERAVTADSRSSDNARAINALKLVDDGQQATLTKIQEKLAVYDAAIAENKTDHAKKAQQFEDLERLLAASARRIDTLEKRLNGTAYEGLEQRLTVEQIGDQIAGLKSTLSGEQFGISYKDVASTARGFATAANVVKFFGATTVLGVIGVLGSSYFGWGQTEDLSGPLDLLTQRVEYVWTAVERHEKTIDGLLQRELNRE